MKPVKGTVLSAIRLPNAMNDERNRIGITREEAAVLGIRLSARQHDDMIAAHGPQVGYKQFREWLTGIIKATG